MTAAKSDFRLDHAFASLYIYETHTLGAPEFFLRMFHKIDGFLDPKK